MTRTRRRFPWLSCYVVMLATFLLLPILLVIPVSFNGDANLSFPPNGVSLRWYSTLFASADFGRAFVISIQSTVIATATSLVIGCLAAYAMARHRFVGRRLLAGLVMGPLVFPQIVLGLAMVMFLNTIGLVRSIPGLVLANVIITLPYVVRTLLPAFQILDSAIDEVAMVLGANRLTVLWRIVLPNVRTGLMAAGVLAGLVAFDEFTIALFITGGETVTLPVQIFLSTYYGVQPTVAALGTLLVAFSAAVVLLLERTLGMERVLGLSQQRNDEETVS